MGLFSRIGSIEKPQVKEVEGNSQIVISVLPWIRSRIHGLRGMGWVKGGRSPKRHDYTSAFARLFAYLDAIGWEPMPAGHKVTGWSVGFESAEEAYKSQLADCESKIGRSLLLHEMVLFAQWHGYGESGIEELVEHEWVLGPWYEEVKANLESMVVEVAEEGAEGEGAGPA
jgi:hypothetical protein